MNEIVTPHRMASQPQSLYFSSEKAGLVLQNQPIPWGAEAVLVEALLRLPPTARKKTDFTLRLNDLSSICAETIRKDESSDRYRLFFRLQPPAVSTMGELFWRHHPLGKLELPVLTAAEFAGDLTIHLPTTFVQINGNNVAARSFAANQCQGLSASAIVRSSTGLAPLLDLGLKVVFRAEQSDHIYDVPVILAGAQLAGKEALVSAAAPKLPRKSGEWTISWMVGDKVLASHRVRAVSLKTLLDSLRVTDTRFVVEAQKTGGLYVRRHLPPLNEIRKAAPCFVVSSKEAGMAGIVHFQVVAQVPGAVQPPTACDQTILITDGPTLVSSSLLDADELAQVSVFELRHKNRVFGSLPLSPVPLATLTGEGGFKSPSDFLWNNIAEDELLERLTKLMDVDRGVKGQ